MRIENSFIPVSGVGESRERSLWEADIISWERFDPTDAPVGPKTATAIESFLAEALPRLDDGDTQYFNEQFPDSEIWRLYENTRTETVFFDIETTGLDAGYNDVTTVSFHQQDETTTLVRGDDLTRNRVREQFRTAPLIASFNGKRFDVPFLEQCFDISIETPHLDLMYPCRRVNLTGGLKSIENEIGIDRDRPDLSGRDAVRLWNQYKRNNDTDALETLISYNRDDTVNLRNLADVVARTLHEQSLGAATGTPCGIADPRE